MERPESKFMREIQASRKSLDCMRGCGEIANLPPNSSCSSTSNTFKSCLYPNPNCLILSSILLSIHIPISKSSPNFLNASYTFKLVFVGQPSGCVAGWCELYHPTPSTSRHIRCISPLRLFAQQSCGSAKILEYFTTRRHHWIHNLLPDLEVSFSGVHDITN